MVHEDDEYTIDLKWFKDTARTAPDALSRLRCNGSKGSDIGTAFPDDPTTTREGHG